MVDPLFVNRQRWRMAPLGLSLASHKQVRLARNGLWLVYTAPMPESLPDSDPPSSFARRLALLAAAEAVLEQLRQRLHLARLPRRIECYDISTIQGRFSVGSGVVFSDGRSDGSQWRRTGDNGRGVTLNTRPPRTRSIPPAPTMRA